MTGGPVPMLPEDAAMTSHRGKLRLCWIRLRGLRGPDRGDGVRLVPGSIRCWSTRWDWSIIPQYLYRWDEERQQWVANLLVQGLHTTIRLALWGIALAAIIGVVSGIMRTSRACSRAC